jgi:hypothetical protein
MKNHVLAVLRSVSLVGVLSCAVICPVYAQGVREIGSNTPVNSDSPVVKATNAVIQLSIRITVHSAHRSLFPRHTPKPLRGLPDNSSTVVGAFQLMLSILGI